MGRVYCFGTENGIVQLYDAQTGKDINIHKSRGFLSIDHMAWSSDGRFICFSDLSKRVFVKSINPNTLSSVLVVESAADVSMKDHTDGPIVQLLFEPGSSRLLVHTTSMLHTISVETSAVESARKLNMTECQWIVHPQHSGFIIGIGQKIIHVLDWTLHGDRTYRFSLDNTHGTLFEEKVAGIQKVLVTTDRKHILVQISRRRYAKEKNFLYFDSSSFPPSKPSRPTTGDTGAPVTITPFSLPPEISSNIMHGLSFLPHDRLVYLSKNFSICACQLSRSTLTISNHQASISKAQTKASSMSSRRNHQSNTGARELFSLPGDWINSDSLLLSRVWNEEKSFLCPRNGEVAVVKCATLV